jgi:hypothetical protein
MTIMMIRSLFTNFWRLIRQCTSINVNKLQLADMSEKKYAESILYTSFCVNNYEPPRYEITMVIQQIIKLLHNWTYDLYAEKRQVSTNQSTDLTFFYKYCFVVISTELRCIHEHNWGKNSFYCKYVFISVMTQNVLVNKTLCINFFLIRYTSSCLKYYLLIIRNAVGLDYIVTISNTNIYISPLFCARHVIAIRYTVCVKGSAL